jgi:hypothetical protein
MKTINSFKIIFLFIIGGLFLSGVSVSQNFSDHIIRMNPEKFPAKSINKPSSSKVHEFKFPCLQQKLIIIPKPHADTIILYSTASMSMKEFYTYDSLESTMSYRRLYLTPDGWVNSFLITNTYDGIGNILTSLLQEWRNNSWVDSSRIVNTYDPDGNMLTNLLQNMVSSVWVNFGLGTYTYDANGNILTEMDQEWDGANWANITLYTYTYDGSWNKLTAQNQQWDGTSWFNSTLDTWTYDGAGNMLTAMNQYWDGTVWVNSSLDTRTYDVDGNLLIYLSQYSEDGITWSNNYQEIYTYDANGRMLSQLIQMYQDPDWVNYELLTDTYDANGNRLTYLVQEWYDVGPWQNYSHGIQTYDENGNCLSFINQLWNANAWRNYEKDEYSFQPNLINGDAYGWNGGDWVLKDGNLQITLNNDGNYITFVSYSFSYNAKVYYSIFPTGTNDFNNLNSTSLSVYPNPATDYLILGLTLRQSENVCFKMYDFSGRIVANYYEGLIKSGEKTFRINTENIPAGEYILQMKAGKVIEKKKVVILK